jgi:hypothetical protein
MLKQHRAVTAAACLGAWAALAAPASADKPATATCAPGFDIGPVAREDYAALPRSAAAIDAGLIDEAGILAGFDRFDKNANGVICVQLSVGFETNNRPFGQYFYNLVDDTSSAQS